MPLPGFGSEYAVPTWQCLGGKWAHSRRLASDCWGKLKREQAGEDLGELTALETNIMDALSGSLRPESLY